MGRFTLVSAAAAAVACVSQPCAAETGNTALFVQQPSAFVGLKLHLPLGTAARPKPSMRLQIKTDFRAREPANPSALAYRPTGFEIGVAKTGQPTLFFNGESAMHARNRLGIAGSGGTTALIVGGVLLAVVVVAVAAGGGGIGDTCPTIDGSRDHCINP